MARAPGVNDAPKSVPWPAATRIETDTFGPIEVPADRYWGAQTERSRRNFRIGEERMPRPLTRALALDQARGSRGQPRTRLARCTPHEGDRARRAGGDRRQARRSLSAAGLADRLRHAEQHERQRGDRRTRQRNAGRQARRQVAGAPERSRQHEPVVERLLPDRDAYRDRRARSRSGSFRRSRICRRRWSRNRRSSPGSSRSAARTPRMRHR